MAHSKGFKKKPKDRSPEPVALGDIVAGLLGSREFSAGAKIGHLTQDWREVVGERLAQESAPAALDGGVLVVACSTSAWAAQIGFLSKDIAVKVNERLGSEAIKRVRVVVAPERLKAL
jgi:predicted nucleic acid-binding Zn ribbon protein